MAGIWNGLRAYPALLRAGFAEAVAYRAEMLVWMLTSTMPLVSMALWAAVAQGRRVGPEGFGSGDFVVYFLLTLMVRLATGSWVLWQMNMEVRTGVLAQRLLRPVHPLIAYSAENLAAVPLRVVLVLPLTLVVLGVSAHGRVTGDPVLLGSALLALPGAWALTFLSMVLIGTLAFYIESALAAFQLWMGMYMLLSGYLMPLSLLPGWARRISEALPFRYMLDFPVKLAMGLPGVSDPRGYALLHLGVEYGYVLLVLLLSGLLWTLGLRRFNAFGA